MLFEKKKKKKKFEIGLEQRREREEKGKAKKITRNPCWFPQLEIDVGLRMKRHRGFDRNQYMGDAVKRSAQLIIRELPTMSELPYSKFACRSVWYPCPRLLPR